jgi:hypothetical protein
MENKDNDSVMTGGGSKYNKNTYIGYFKEKNGGIKIVPGEMDNKIISKRNKILSHLEKVLFGGKRLKEKNIEKYFKALGGKYIRNDICINSKNCKNGKSVSINGADKLLKIASKQNYNMNTVLNKFKGSAPVLYEKLENKISGGKQVINYNTSNRSVSPARRVSPNRGGHNPAINYNRQVSPHAINYNRPASPNRGGYNPAINYNRPVNPNNYNRRFYGGDAELNKFRMDIGRHQNLSELDKLRNEIELLRK